MQSVAVKPSSESIRQPQESVVSLRPDKRQQELTEKDQVLL